MIEMEEIIELEKVYGKNEYAYCPIFTRIYLDAVKDKPQEEIIDFVKKENEMQVIEALKDKFEFLRAEHKVVPDLEFANCLRLLSAYYFKRKGE